ncbi:MAG TPA: EscU/YscU/HrcU family type III secretion system export apparatus switch protein [Noviherbaspirillum sp.]
MNRPNPAQNAVALAYQTGDLAPKVVAKGRGLIAEEIIARAREHGVFVHESKELVALLMQVDLDKHIPPTLYRVVAELLAWLYHIDAIKHTGDKGPHPRP